jgi:predicted transcriptional regulator
MIEAMKLTELIKLVQGEVLTRGVNLEREVKGGCGADLMSDVLAYSQPDAVLMTGLCNKQVVRTAQMADVAAVVFVRDKQPNDDTIQLANETGIPLITTMLGMFEACGRLYRAGVPSLETPFDEG